MKDYPGPYLGECANNPGALLRYKLANLNLTTFGPPGSNKTVGLAVPAAMLDQSQFRFDPKGQDFAITGRVRKRKGRVYRVSPKDLSGDRWSPLHQIARPDSPDFMGDCGCVASSMQSKGGNDSSASKFFDISAENLTTIAIAHECMTKGDKADLRNVRELLSQPSKFDKGEPVSGLALALKGMTLSPNYAVATTASRILARMSDSNSLNTALQDVIDTALKDMKWLNDDVAAASMTRGRIPWADLHTKIITVYLVVPIEDLNESSLGKYVRVFLNLGLRQLYRAAPKAGSATLPRILFIIDELASIGRLNELPTALGTARDFSLTMWFFLQSLSQLRVHYKDDFSLFFTGSGVINTFRCADYDTADYLSKIFGNSERMVMTQGADGRSSLTPHAIPLIRPEDLMRLPRGVTVNSIQPCPYPILGRVPVYTKTPWAAEFDDNPYYRG